MTRVVLAAAHLDGDPTNNRMKNLRALCQRCHMLHDRPHHLAQRAGSLTDGGWRQNSAPPGLAAVVPDRAGY
jgi:hypothetical protein